MMVIMMVGNGDDSDYYGVMLMAMVMVMVTK